MVDAARQMLDELMGRNRNLHPSEAPKVIIHKIFFLAISLKTNCLYFLSL